ncbi:MAG TPA: type II secretion system protein GspG [Thermoanaerobaculia bacterium]|nr:type II secretion system protein GspG [Thermoanaerobaculia bacterium]
MKRIIIVTVVVSLIAAVAYGGSPYMPTDAERARWTLHDMKSWKIALEAYRQDNGSYPAGATLQDAAVAVEGKYISTVPMHDAWGRAYVYESTNSGFILASAGADGRFDRSSWATAGQLDSLEGDAVITEQGRFWLRSWKFR